METENGQSLRDLVLSALDNIGSGRVSPVLSADTQSLMDELKRDGFQVFVLTPLLRQQILCLCDEGQERSCRVLLEGVHERMFRWMIRLGELPLGEERARIVQRLVDQALERSEQNHSSVLVPTCRRGCSFCCHTPVNLTPSEGRLILESLKDEPVAWNRGLAEKQSQSLGHANYHENLDWKESACVFLGAEGECRIYAVRPVSCRKVQVVSEARLCDPRVASEPSYVLNLESEIIAAAFYNIERNAEGDLPILSQFLASSSY